MPRIVTCVQGSLFDPQTPEDFGDIAVARAILAYMTILEVIPPRVHICTGCTGRR
jgi:hypothetical protein